MRQKKPLESTVEKYVNFLHYIWDNNNTSITYLIQSYNINKSVKRAIVDMKIIKLNGDCNWTWLTDEPTKQMALEVLNYLLELNKKQVFVAIPEFDDIKAYIKEIRDHMISNATQNNNSTQGLKQPLLNRALQQSEMNNNHLFSVVDNKDAKLFELVKHIAGNCIDRNVLGSYSEDDESMLCDAIIRISKMLISKL